MAQHPLEALLRKLAEDPRKLERMLDEVMPIVKARNQFFNDIKAEKGKDHELYARVSFKIAGLVGALAATHGGIIGGQMEPSDIEYGFKSMVDMASSICTEVRDFLNIPHADAEEILKASSEMATSVFHSSTEVAKGT